MSEKAKLIFLVEDNEMFSQTVKIGVAKRAGYEVITFGTGEKMFEYLEKEKSVPDIIVLDYILNSVDSYAKNGGEILELLRTKYKGQIANAPVIMLSASTDVKDAVDLLKRGAKDYILKDAAFLDNLVKSLENIIELKALRAEMSLYKNEAQSLKKRLWLTVAVVVVFVVVVGSYFIWFKG